MRRITQLLWTIFVLPVAMIAFALYIVGGFIWISAFGNMGDETRDPCERFGYRGSLEKYKRGIAKTS